MPSLTATRRRDLLAGSALVVLLLASCQAGSPSASGPIAVGESSPTTSAPAAKAAITITPADAATKVRPDQPVTVSVTDGTLDEVLLKSGDSDPVEGEFSTDRTSWTSTQNLRAKKRYTLAATAKNPEGVSTTQTSSFSTLTPKDSADYFLVPSGSGPVGVGMPVVVQFAGLVDKDKQADIEKKVSVTSVPQMDGAWGWLDARQLIWRPATYWKPGTKVTVKADIGGIETRAGVWTSRSATNTFTIGDAMVSTVDTKTHRMTVTRNGKVLRTLKVSTGRPGSETETRNGVKVILSRESQHTMDSATVGIKKGDPGYYRIDTKWAMRLTWSGEFLHSAPWSVGSQGNANVSHGCTNLSPSDAKWLFDNSHVGDIVKFTGSSRKLEEYNGYTMWNMSLAQWAKHSALS
ncbi:MAG TPA: Ig-like domain-containing protein [Actinomycetales bacterium]|nr:Ig-like domain-containing protein [Actinomycetales bacterium]